MDYNTYRILYNNILELFNYNKITLSSPEITNQELFNNIKTGSYERVEIDGKKDNKNYKVILFPEVNKYTKKKNATDLLNRYIEVCHKLLIICTKEEHSIKLKVVWELLGFPENMIISTYEPFMYQLPKHCHGNEIKILTEEETNLLLKSYNIKKEYLPKIKYGTDALLLWNFDFVKKGDIIVIDDVSDNSGGIYLYRYVI